MKIMRDKNLTIKQKIKIFAYKVSMKKRGIYKNIKKYADEIKQLNPELEKINPRDIICQINDLFITFVQTTKLQNK